MSQAHLLLVEDDPALAGRMAYQLRSAGYRVGQVADGLQALSCFDQQAWDLVLLGLPRQGLDGFEVCRRLRERACYVPVIMLGMPADESARLRGLELGADDCLSKTISVQELLARVHALLRRVQLLRLQAWGNAASPPQGPCLQVGSLRMGLASRRVWLAGAELSLTLREFDLLHFLARHPGRIFSRGELLQRVWGDGFDGYEHTVNSHVNRLRSKLERGCAVSRLVETVWGLGYRFQVPEEGPAAAGDRPRLSGHAGAGAP